METREFDFIVLEWKSEGDQLSKFGEMINGALEWMNYFGR